MKKVIMYNRLIRSPTRKPYIIFNSKKKYLKNLDIAEIVKVGGKPYSVYFYHKPIKGLRTE
jgi:hypothetical protein